MSGSLPQRHRLATVLLYTPLYPPRRGGSANYYSNLVESLSDDYELLVVTSYHPDRRVVSDENGARVYRIVPRFETLPRLVRVLLEVPVAFVAAVTLWIVARFAVVHAHSTSVGAVGIAAAAAVTRTEIIYDCRDADFPPWLVTIGKTPVWFSCASNIDERLEQSGIESEQIIRTPVVNPPYVKEYTSTPVSTDDGVDIIYVGAIRPGKGVFLLLRSFTEFHTTHPGSTLTVVGDGPASNRLRQQVNEELRDSIRLTGTLNHRSTLERIAQADVLILPSESEGMPRVIREAVEIGTPVIATEVGDVSELVTDGKTGLLIEQSESELLAALERIASDQDFLRRLRRGCLTTDTGARWVEAVERVAAGYHRAATA